MTLCVLRKEEHDVDDLARLATCGRPVPRATVALLDDDAQRGRQGAQSPGELVVHPRAAS